MTQRPQEVVITTKNTAALTLGIISLVIGVFSLLFGWIPFLGLLAIPTAVIGAVLAFLGLIIALFKGFRGAGLPLIGFAVCAFAIIFSLVSTGGASVAIKKAMDESSRKVGQQDQALEEESKDPEELQKAEAALPEENVKQDYIAKVKLYDFEATRINTYTNKNVPAVRFSIKNEGERTLNKVEVTVYFKDANGSVIFEEDYYPVLVSEYSLSDNKPLKPNYIKRQAEGTYYTIEQLGPEWKTGAAEAVVTDIEFAP